MKISLSGILTVYFFFLYSFNTFSQDSTKPAIPSLPPDSTSPVSPVKVIPKDSIPKPADSFPSRTKTPLLIPVQQDATRRSDIYINSQYSTQHSLRYRDPQFFRLQFNYRFGKVDVSLFKRKNNREEQDNLQNNIESPVN